MRTKILLLLSVVLTLGLYSCKEEDMNQDEGELKVYLSDNPVLYDEVNVDIQEVRVHSDANGWQTIATNVGVYNLLDYANGPDTLIASAVLGTGRISQVRLVLGTNNTVVIGGVSYPLETPSAQQSGLKLNVQADILPGAVYIMELDFDAARSIVVTGNGTYMLKPVIRVITTSNSGKINGNVSPVLSRPTVLAINGTDTVATIADISGYFEIGGLVTGNYDVVFLPISPFMEQTISSVSVTAGATTTLNTVTIIQ